MTDSMGPGKLVCHMQNPSYTYDEYLICIGLGPSISSVICINLSYSGPSYPIHLYYLWLWLLRYTCIVAAPRVTAMQIVFEYTHLYIRIQTTIRKMECPTNCGLGNWWKYFKSAALRIEVPPFYVVGALVNGARLLIPVEVGDRSCPYKVKRRSGFQIVQADLSK